MRGVNVELVIFDCDGVLVDSETISNEVLARMLSAQGLPTTTETARRDYQGLLLADILSRAQEQLGHALPDDWLTRYEHDREVAFRRELTPIAGAAEAVRYVRESGVAVCVASQGKLSKTRLSLALTGLSDLFANEALFSAHSVARGKPHPDLFLSAAGAMGVSPSRCLVVEDSSSGVTAAVAAGMRVIGYSADADELALREAGADVLRSLDELPAYLGVS